MTSPLYPKLFVDCRLNMSLRAARPTCQPRRELRCKHTGVEMSERILRSVVEGVCTLTLNRPEKLNALDTQTFRELDAHLSFIERQEQKLACVVLRGAGRGFCAGAEVCFTGGLELALACDLIVAGASARFADTHAKWGLVAAWGLTQRLPRRVGSAAAKRMMMTSRLVPADEAHKMGLVDVLSPDDDFSNALTDL